MDRRLSLALLTLTLVAGLFLGCASVPPSGRIPAKESADDSLVLLPVYIENKTGATNARKYAYEFSGEYGTITLPNNTGYIVLLTHEPGVILNKLKTYIPQGQGVYGDSNEWDLDIQLPYEPGKMVVAPFMFTMRYVSDNAGGFTCYTNVVKADDEQKQETLKRATAQENAATWEQ